MMGTHPALVGLVPRKNLWSVIQKERWYHVPFKSAPRNSIYAEYLAFYFPSVFGEGDRYKVIYGAKVLGVDKVKRIHLFPDERDHKRAQQDYLQFHLGKIEKLPRPIPSKNWRRIIHIPTSIEKLFSALEINDLYDTSPLEDKMYWEMKRRKIEAERQLCVQVGGKKYFLDFGVFCVRGNIDVECDGEKYHTLPDALTRDRMRNNQLTSYGWRVLRFIGKEVNGNIGDCFEFLERTIGILGGINQGSFYPEGVAV